MAIHPINISVPFESLLNTINNLSLTEKLRLWKLLHKQLEQAEEDTLLADPKVKSEIHEARVAYKTGDYMFLDDYISDRKNKT